MKFNILIELILVNFGFASQFEFLPKTEKIVQGRKAELNQFPYHVDIKSFQNKENSTTRIYALCGGSIIKDDWILTVNR
jgi:hypothetical protein